MYASWKLASSSPLGGLQTLILLKKGKQVATAENSRQNRKKTNKRQRKKVARCQQMDW